MGTHSRIQELANNWQIENSRNKSHAKISEFIVVLKKEKNQWNISLKEGLTQAKCKGSWPSHEQLVTW